MLGQRVIQFHINYDGLVTMHDFMASGQGDFWPVRPLGLADPIQPLHWIRKFTILPGVSASKGNM